MGSLVDYQMVALTFRLLVGHLIAMFFVVIPKLRFSESPFLVAFFYLILTTFLAQKPHVGSQVQGALSFVSAAIWGGGLSCVTFIDDDVAVVLISALVIFPILILVMTHPATRVHGLLAIVIFGLGVIGSEDEPSDIAEGVWTLISSAVVAAVLGCVTSIIIFPRWSIDSVNKALSKACKQAAQSVTGTCSIILCSHLDDLGNPVDVQENIEKAWTQLSNISALKGYMVYEWRSHPVVLSSTECEEVAVLLARILVQISAIDTMTYKDGRRYKDGILQTFWGDALPALRLDMAKNAAMLHRFSTTAKHNFRQHSEPSDDQPSMMDSLGWSDGNSSPSTGSAAGEKEESEEQQLPTVADPLYSSLMDISIYKNREGIFRDIQEGYNTYIGSLASSKNDATAKEVRALLFCGTMLRSLGDIIIQLQRRHAELIHPHRDVQKHCYTFFSTCIHQIIAPVEALVQTICSFCRNAKENGVLPTLRKEIVFRNIYFFKLYFMCVFIFSILLLVPGTKDLGDFGGQWAFVTVLVVFQRTLEATFQRAVFRVFATAVGCFFGYLIISDDDRVNDPYMVSLLTSILMIPAFLFVQTKWRYATFMYALSLDLVVLTQYGLEDQRFAGVIAMERGLSVLFGAAIAFVVAQCVPVYASVEAQFKFSEIIEKISASISNYIHTYEKFETLGPHGGLLPPTPTDCQEIKTGLRDVADVLEKGSVAWGRGPCSAPRSVRNLLPEATMTLRRLFTMRTVLQRRPVLGDRMYRKRSLEYLLSDPFHEHLQTTLEACSDLLQRIAETLRTECSYGNNPMADCRQNLLAALKTLNRERNELNRLYDQQREAWKALLQAKAVKEDRLNADDAILFTSLYYSWMWVLNTLAIMTKKLLDMEIENEYDWQLPEDNVDQYVVSEVVQIVSVV